MCMIQKKNLRTNVNPQICLAHTIIDFNSCLSGSSFPKILYLAFDTNRFCLVLARVYALGGKERPDSHWLE
jgi:hypothetical protein